MALQASHHHQGMEVQLYFLLLVTVIEHQFLVA
jgi:hypothetical protein